MELNEIWKNICIIHEQQKKLNILGEEFGKDFLGFYQPNNELKNALEHLIRAKSQELGLRTLNPETDLSEDDYILSNTRKAMAHEYRAFFDTADFLSVTIRGRILKALSSYSPIEISTAIPEYYKDHRKRIDEITLDIAQYRGMKDVGKVAITIPTVEKYAAACEELLAIYHNIVGKLGILVEVSKQMRKEKEEDRKRELKIKIIFALSGAAGATIIGLLIKIFV